MTRDAARRTSRGRGPALAAALLALLALDGCSLGLPSSPTPSDDIGAPSAATSVVRLGVDLPLSGGEALDGLPILDGVRLAVADANADGGVAGATIDIDARDDAVNGVDDPGRGADNLLALAGDPSVIGVVGPLNSAVAREEIPVGNAAGLVQCSPSNTDPDLTKPMGADDPTTYRPAHPDDIAYVRVSATDDQEAAAGAQIAYGDIAARRALVIDDGTRYGQRIADAFEGAFTALGGTVVGRELVGLDPASEASAVQSMQASRPDVVYFGGYTNPAGAALRQQMAAGGFGSTPFVGGDAINDGSASSPGSFLQRAGEAGDPDTWSTTPTAHDLPAGGDIATRYRAAFGADPGAYSLAAYACAKVILDALGHVGTADRDAIRRDVTGGTTFDTPLGPLRFDANGDGSQAVVSEYRDDPATSGGDWQFVRQVNMAAPGG